MKKIPLFLKRFFVFKFFIMGIFIAFILHFSGSCNKDDDPFTPTEETVDVSKISDGAKSAETAFLSADVENIKNILTEDALKTYGTALSQADEWDLLELGEALKSRELKVYSSMYAEYSYIKGGITYTFAMARKEDGSWKLMRF